MSDSLPTGGRVLLLAGGAAPSRALFRRLLELSHVFYCVDAGANTACRLNATPRAVFGDFDSVSEKARRLLAGSEWYPTPDQEFQDIYKALERLISEGAHAISVAGALGGRADHTFANLGALLRFSRDAAITFHAASEDIFALKGRWRMEDARALRRISILPMFGPARVRTDGLRYPLEGEILELGVRDGLSNSALGGPVSIEVSERPALVCVQRLRPSAIVFAPEVARP